MKLFVQLLPDNTQILLRTFLLTLGLFVTVLLPIMIAEGCVKRPSLEPAPGAAPQRFLTP